MKEQLDRIEWKLDQIMAALLRDAGEASGMRVESAFKDKHHPPKRDGYLHLLTTKQHCTLQMLLRGGENQEIADRMGISINTAKVHVRGIAKKLGVNTRAQIVYALLDEFNEADENGYMMMTGGLPKDWDANFSVPDPFADLYAEKRHEPEAKSAK